MAFSSRHPVALKFPKEALAFLYMQHRVKHRKLTATGMSTAWQRTPEGFLAFLKYVGNVPKSMKRPTIGRKNHSKGYQPGNCGWQEYSENCAESAIRNHIGKSRAKKTRIKMKKSQNERRESERNKNDGKRCFYHKNKSRKKMSDSHKGKIASRETKLKMKQAQIKRRIKEKSK